MSADDLLEVLPRVARAGEYEGSGLTRSVGAYLSGCRITEVERLLVGIHVCLKIPPLVERRQLELSEEYSWMLGLATEACERLVVERHPSALGKSALSPCRWPASRAITMVAMSRPVCERSSDNGLN